MEKFSAYRDPGTGIQPFLAPVPPASAPDPVQAAVRFLGFGLGAVRMVLIAMIALLYLVLVEGLCLFLALVPPLYHAATHIFTFILGKLTLWVLGVYWIHAENVTRKRTGRNAQLNQPWNPSAGDLIISNWTSWVEILWLAVRCNPVFVLPIPEHLPEFAKTTTASVPVSNRPGRATGTGSANVQTSKKHSTVPPVPLKGFRRVSLLQMICLTGRFPPYFKDDSRVSTIEEIRKSSRRPVVVFPECTTSNGRGLLRFANVFKQNIPVKGYQIFIMCVRHDPPTTNSPTLTQPVASPGPIFLNSISHVFKIASSFKVPNVSIYLLPPSESPSSQIFMASDYIKGIAGEDQLAEASANLIAQIGRLKRTGMGWEDKASFVHYRNLKLR